MWTGLLLDLVTGISRYVGITSLPLYCLLTRMPSDHDGKNFDPDSDLVRLIIGLLKRGLYVAVVTAAGYADQAERYEERLSGLLLGFWRRVLDAESMARFYVFGIRCLAQSVANGCIK